MFITLLVVSVSAALSTFLGGLFALRFKDRAHLIVGFSAGTVVGVAFFVFLSEALEIGGMYNTGSILSMAALGFIVYLLIDRFFHTHRDAEDHHDHEHTHRGVVRATSLSVHSFLDGIGIGLAFQVSSALGIVVTIAVLAHDFSDGINTVSAIVKGGGDRKRALKWLLVDSIAPVLGIFSTLFFSVSDASLGLILSVFAGFFLYLGASDLVPESYHAHPTKWTTFATILGVVFIYLIIGFAG